jgi:hypothetical protein
MRSYLYTPTYLLAPELPKPIDVKRPDGIVFATSGYGKNLCVLHLNNF